MSKPRRPIRLACVLTVLSCFGMQAATAVPANPRAEMVTAKPTVKSLEGRNGRPVLFDDGKCPKGQIAQFVKRGGQAQMRRSCVDRPA